jgi:hypothetical protein
LGELPGWPLGSGEASGELTDRQREVVQLVAEGHPVKEIAAILNISRKTASALAKTDPPVLSKNDPALATRCIFPLTLFL